MEHKKTSVCRKNTCNSQEICQNCRYIHVRKKFIKEIFRLIGVYALFITLLILGSFLFFPSLDLLLESMESISFETLLREYRPDILRLLLGFMVLSVSVIGFARWIDFPNNC